MMIVQPVSSRLMLTERRLPSVLELELALEAAEPLPDRAATLLLAERLPPPADLLWVEPLPAELRAEASPSTEAETEPVSATRLSISLPSSR